MQFDVLVYVGLVFLIVLVLAGLDWALGSWERRDARRRNRWR